MFKICVIGCGDMSTTGHGPSFKKYKNDYIDVSLSACCDLNEEKAKEYAQKFGFEKYYTDYEKMLDEIKPDAVSLISPVKVTKNLSIDIMKKGYNIILEKPPGLNSDETRQMLEAAKKSGVFVRTSFNRRYTPVILKLKENLRDKNIFNITYQMYRHGRKDKDFATTAIHAIDVVKNIAGADYKKVEFTYQELPEIGENVTNIYLNCLFENGIVAQITIVPVGGCVLDRITVNTFNETYFAEIPLWYSIDSKGGVRVVKEKKIILDISGDELTDGPEEFEGSGFYEENRSFFEMIKNNTKPSCDLESTVQSVEIADCIRKRKSFYIKY